MKRLLYFLLLLPLLSSAQKIRINEIDKFIKQKRIETFPLTLLSSSNIKLAVTLSAVGSSVYVQLSGSGLGAHRIEEHDKVIFLFDNDSTVTVRSKGYQNFEIGITVNSYKHSYIVTIPELMKLSQYNLQALRKYHSEEYDDIYISSEGSEQFKKLTAIFISELAKENMIPTAKPVNVRDIVRYVGDSVTFTTQVTDSRYLFESNEATTLLDFGSAYPNQFITAVIQAKDKAVFGNEPANYYKGKRVRVTGRIITNNNKPYIELVQREQLQVLEDSGAIVQNAPRPVNTTANNTTAMAAPSRAPGFPGGYQVWMDFLNRNLKPPTELAAGEKKTVVVKFSVSADGTVSNIQIVQSAGDAFDKEVLRVLGRMPKWKAAFENGQPANATITQPVTFYGVVKSLTTDAKKPF